MSIKSKLSQVEAKVLLNALGAGKMFAIYQVQDSNRRSVFGCMLRQRWGYDGVRDGIGLDSNKAI